MQRNMDLVRTILMRLENYPSGQAPQDLDMWGFPLQEILYHAHIMRQEGLIERHDVFRPDGKGPETVPTSLTWQGHEFLDLARDQERWNRAKAIIAKVRSAPISVWKKVLTDLLLQSVEGVAGPRPSAAGSLGT